MGNEQIMMYTMKDCPLCEKAKELLDLWGFRYYVIDIEPCSTRSYPFFSIGDTIYKYIEMVDMIAKDKLQGVLDIADDNYCSCDFLKCWSNHTCGRKPYCEVYPLNKNSWSYLCIWHCIFDRVKCILYRKKNVYYILKGDENE